MQGWIKLHRKFIEWEWYNDINTKTLFLHLILKANHEKKKWMGQTVDKGQLITGVHSLTAETGLTIQKIRTSLNKLKSTNEITIKTSNKFSIITINNWGSHQEQQAKQQTTNKQLTTTKNDKNEKKLINFFKFKDGTRGFRDKRTGKWKECDTFQELQYDPYLKELKEQNA